MKTPALISCNGQVIHGKYYATFNSPLATLVLLPGLPGNEEDVLGLGEALSGHGLNVLTFNYRGTHQSEGVFSLKNTLEDIHAAVTYARESIVVDAGSIILGGWSYGAGMGLIYAAGHPDMQYVFSISGTDHGEFAREYQRNEGFAKLVNEDAKALTHPDGPVRFAEPLTVTHELIPNVKQFDLLSHAAELFDRHVLLMGGWDDVEVLLEDHVLPCYRALKKLGSERVSIEVFPDDHFFLNSKAALLKTITSWVRRVLA